MKRDFLPVLEFKLVAIKYIIFFLFNFFECDNFGPFHPTDIFASETESILNSSTLWSTCYVVPASIVLFEICMEYQNLFMGLLLRNTNVMQLMRYEALK